MRNLSPKLQALIFVVLTYAISWAEQIRTIHNGQDQNSIDGLLLMWTPGVVALVLSPLFGNRFKDLAFTRPDLRSLCLAYGVPAISSVLVLGMLVLCQITQFEISSHAIEKKGSVSAVLISAFLMAPTIGMVIPFISGLGEEIGWRGFLHSKLINRKANHRYFLTGLIWSVWHWPLIIFGTYATSDKPWLSVIIFTIVQCSFSFLMGFLRDRSQSVFPAALAHGAHNMWFLGISPVFFRPNSLTPYFASESGVFCAFIYLGVAILIARSQSSSRVT